MGLRRIDNIPKPLTAEEWHRRELRKHNLQRWAITILEIAFMAGVVWAMIHFFGEVHP